MLQSSGGMELQLPYRRAIHLPGLRRPPSLLHCIFHYHIVCSISHTPYWALGGRQVCNPWELVTECLMWAGHWGWPTVPMRVIRQTLMGHLSTSPKHLTYCVWLPPLEHRLHEDMTVIFTSVSPLTDIVYIPSKALNKYWMNDYWALMKTRSGQCSQVALRLGSRNKSVTFHW